MTAPPVDEGLTIADVLDLVERSPEAGTPLPQPARSVRLRTSRVTAGPLVAAGARGAVSAAGAVVLLVLVSLAALAVVAAEGTAHAVTAAELPDRARRSRRWIDARVADLEPRLQAWSERAAQWALGPQGLWRTFPPRA